MELESGYKKLRIATELNKKTLDSVRMFILTEEDGAYDLPDDKDIAIYLNVLAKENKIDHYILRGANADIILFDKDNLKLPNFELKEMKATKPTSVVKINSYEDKVSFEDDLPPEISSIKDLYTIPRSLLGCGCCVYFLCKGMKVVYVGQTQHVHRRVVAHTKDKDFDNAYYIRVPFNKMNDIEASLIAELKPIYNKTLLKKSNYKSEIARSIITSEEGSNTVSKKMNAVEYYRDKVVDINAIHTGGGSGVEKVKLPIEDLYRLMEDYAEYKNK